MHHVSGSNCGSINTSRKSRTKFVSRDTGNLTFVYKLQFTFLTPKPQVHPFSVLSLKRKIRTHFAPVRATCPTLFLPFLWLYKYLTSTNYETPHYVTALSSRFFLSFTSPCIPQQALRRYTHLRNKQTFVPCISAIQ